MKTMLQCTAAFRDLRPLGDQPVPWNHMVPKGEFPGTIEIPAGYDVPGHGVVREDMEIEGVTVLGERELENIIRSFTGDMLIDADHLSHDEEHNTEALGWGHKIRPMTNPGDGLEVETEWTPLGRDKITNRIYRFISPEFAGSVRFEGGLFRFHPSALTGAGLTNRPKLKTLNPVSANRGDADPSSASGSVLCALRELVGAAETDTDEKIATLVEAHKNRMTEMQREIERLHSEALDRDLEAYSDVIVDKESAKALFQANREAARKSFGSIRSNLGVGPIQPPIYQRNRATPPDGRGFREGSDADGHKMQEADAHVALVKARDRCSFESAWATAKAEKPELFQ